jgi:hypothetical protein
MLQNKIKSEGETDEKFYDDLDEKRSHSSCCTCQTLALLFIVLLIILIIGAFYVYRQITMVKIPNNVSLNFSNKNLAGMLGDLKPDVSGDVKIVLSEEDLSTLLSNGLSFQNFVLSDAQTTINSDEIIVYASLIKPISSKIVIGLTPKVDNGQIIFTVNSVNAGTWKAPKFIVNQLGKGFADSVDSKFSLIDKKLNVKEISLQDRHLTIIGNLK